MKFTFKIFSLLIAFVLVTGFANMNVMAEDVNLNQTPSVSVNAGDTVVFKANSFFIDLEFLAGGELPPGATSSISAANTQIYAKVLDTHSIAGEIYNPTTGDYDAANSLFVDLAVGAILGETVTIEDGEDLSLTFPEGTGLAIPGLFSGHTDFDFYYDNEAGLHHESLPIPLFLNSEWDRHEAYLTAVSAEAPTGTNVEVINDAAQFGIEISGLEIRDEDSEDEESEGELIGTMDIVVKWDKSNNAISQAKVVFTDTDNTVRLNIDFVFDDLRNVGINVSVGDEYSVSLSDYNFDFALTGEAEELEDDLTELDTELTNLEAVDALIKMTVTEVSGLYYKTTVEVYNSTTTEFDDMGEQWFVGFGRVGYGAVSGTGMVGFATAITGPVVTPDFTLWRSWDATMVSIFAIIETEINDLFEVVEEEDETINSLEGTFQLSYSSSGEYSYGYEASGTVDLNVTEQYETYTQNSALELTFDHSLTVNYNKYGRLQSIDFDLSMFLNLEMVSSSTEEGETGSGSIDIDELTFKLTFNHDTLVEDTGPGGDGVGDGFLDNLPISSGSIWLFAGSMLLAAIVLRRRN
jgi:hypothetical protein